MARLGRMIDSLRYTQVLVYVHRLLASLQLQVALVKVNGTGRYHQLAGSPNGRAGCQRNLKLLWSSQFERLPAGCAGDQD